MSEQTNADVTENKEPQAEPVVENQGAKPEQETLGENGLKALNTERELRKEADKRLKEALDKISAFEDMQRTEEEKREHALKQAQDQLAEARAEQERLAHEILARDVATEFQIPANAVHRLQGSTREELEADAKELAKLFAPKGARKPEPVREVGAGARPKTTTAQMFGSAIQSAFGN